MIHREVAGAALYLERRGDRAQCQLCATGTSNIEIITHVSERTVTHRDGLGNEGRIEAGNVQVVSASTDIRHAEHKLEQASARIVQISIMPTLSGGSPAWAASALFRGRALRMFRGNWEWL
jgi:Pirin